MHHHPPVVSCVRRAGANISFCVWMCLCVCVRTDQCGIQNKRIPNSIISFSYNYCIKIIQEIVSNSHTMLRAPCHFYNVAKPFWSFNKRIKAHIFNYYTHRERYVYKIDLATSRYTKYEQCNAIQCLWNKTYNVSKLLSIQRNNTRVLYTFRYGMV